MEHSAKRLTSGEYSYRGWTIDRLDATDTPNGYGVQWRVVAPDGSCDDWEDTLRKAKSRVDGYEKPTT